MYVMCANTSSIGLVTRYVGKLCYYYVKDECDINSHDSERKIIMQTKKIIISI